MTRAAITDLSCLTRESDETYFAQRREYLSSHRLADFRKCPRLFRKKEQGLIPDEDKPSYVLGRATHTLVLEGEEKFNADYAVGGPINPKTGKPYGPRTKKYEEWAEAIGKPVLTDAQYSLLANLAASVAEQDLAGRLLSGGIAEGVVREEYCGIRCQGRLDWFNPVKGIVDLKTCDDLTWFENDARKFGYAYQMAFYRALLAIALGQAPTDIDVHIIAVEKKEPFRCGVWRIAPDVLAIAAKENEDSIQLLMKCRATDYWPTGYEELRTLDWI